MIYRAQVDPRTTSADDWALLQQATISLMALSAVAKQLYWTAAGMNLGRMQMLFEDVSDTARTDADSVAERLATVGGRPNARPDAVAVAAQTFLDFSDENGSEAFAIEVIRGALASVRRDVESVRSALGLRDPVTASVLEIVATDLIECTASILDTGASSSVRS